MGIFFGIERGVPIVVSSKNRLTSVFSGDVGKVPIGARGAGAEGSAIEIEGVSVVSGRVEEV
jgi:hypothetical protein